MAQGEHRMKSNLMAGNTGQPIGAPTATEMDKMRLFEKIYFQLRARDVVYGINFEGRKVLRYIEARWGRTPQEPEQ
jgi:hypothetical protein